ncbi:hypothetical protein [Cellulomonas edaphi]|uniref:DUF3099 domain-containing protein n=1 Tax=Cellulomonas edaphi TaxID=3053468 RepID=A0ABT7SAF0_9CELL|nr:hypothetical protein [Cellulomons edaphi]MDM7832602.1 hypothetical protein [Cellulomons edaphi]
MGRHASVEPTPQEQGHPRRTVWLERVGMGLAAGVVILLVLRWADLSWATAAAIAVGVTVLVPLAAWVASTVPGHDSGRTG